MHTDHLVALIINNRISNMPSSSLNAASYQSDVDRSDIGIEINNLDPLIDSHVALGAPLPSISLDQLEMDMSLPPQPDSPSDRTEHALTAPSIGSAAVDISLSFRNLRRRITHGLSAIISAEKGKYHRVTLQGAHMVRIMMLLLFRLLHVSYSLNETDRATAILEGSL